MEALVSLNVILMKADVENITSLLMLLVVKYISTVMSVVMTLGKMLL